MVDSDSGFVRVLAKRLGAIGWRAQLMSSPAPVEELQGMRLHAITRYREARAMLTDPRFAPGPASYASRPDVPEEYRPYLQTMQEQDGPGHLRLRKAVARRSPRAASSGTGPASQASSTGCSTPFRSPTVPSTSSTASPDRSRWP